MIQRKSSSIFLSMSYQIVKSLFLLNVKIFSIPCKKLDNADYLVYFELFFGDIHNLDILSNEDLDFVKAKTNMFSFHVSHISSGLFCCSIVPPMFWFCNCFTVLQYFDGPTDVQLFCQCFAVLMVFYIPQFQILVFLVLLYALSDNTFFYCC